MSIQTKDYTSKKTGKTTTKYYAVVFDPQSNKPIWSSGFAKRKDAKLEEASMIEKLDKGELKGKSKAPLFSEVAELWLKSAKQDYADSTWRVYDYDYHHFLEPIFGDKKINRITTAHVIAYRTECEYSEEKAKALKEDPDLDLLNYKPETVNKIINIMCDIFNFAKDVLKVIPDTPMTGVSRCKVGEVKHTTWTEEEITYYLELPFVAESPYYAMLIVMFATGARPGEICGLAESDLTAKRILTLNRGLNRYGNTSDLKNDRSHRPLKISEELYDLILDQLKRKRKDRFVGLASGEMDPEDVNDFLFVGLQGQPVKPDTLSKNFKRLLRRNNKEIDELTSEGRQIPEGRRKLPDMRLYDTRHSFATNLMLGGKKSKLIAEIMGNSVKTMEHHYAHLGETAHEEVLEDYGAKVIPLRKHA
ncbi:MAG: tyrosine-type recombinase/integrase [Parabacteroides sp.]|nr:tyrosine-type recombinase/integrase [Parabacteroides sp.]